MSLSFLKHKRQITLKGQVGKNDDMGGATGTVSATGAVSGTEALAVVSEGAGDVGCEG
jgi:hypothetical protein